VLSMYGPPTDSPRVCGSGVWMTQAPMLTLGGINTRETSQMPVTKLGFLLFLICLADCFSGFMHVVPGFTFIAGCRLGPGTHACQTRREPAEGR